MKIPEFLRTLAWRINDAIAAPICRARGHRYFAPDGAYDNATIYFCLRCGEPSRPLYSPDVAVPDDILDFNEDCYLDTTPEGLARIDRDFARAKRWHPALPWPRWL